MFPDVAYVMGLIKHLNLQLSFAADILRFCKLLNCWVSFFFLTILKICLTLSNMKTSSLTIRLDKDLEAMLSKASRRSGKNRSAIARDALRRQLRLEQFEDIRKRVMPFAEARGYLTDDDIFSQIS
jgi:predicted transcriptional regulator